MVWPISDFQNKTHRPTYFKRQELVKVIKISIFILRLSISEWNFFDPNFTRYGVVCRGRRDKVGEGTWGKAGSACWIAEVGQWLKAVTSR